MSMMLPTADSENPLKTSCLSPMHIYNNDIIFEIFTWLPAKSLMRFQRISKFWRTKISSDSYFLRLHRSRAGIRPDGTRILFHVENDVFDPPGSEHWFISIDKEGRSSLTDLYTHYCPVNQYKLVIDDGLVCFYSELTSKLSASLHNLSTHESVILPENSKFKRDFRRFLFIGFDSSRTLCKILCKTDLFGYQTVFEIYTVGGANNSWRIINSPPFECFDCYPYNSRVCIDGVVYWISYCSNLKKDKSFRGLNIKAFDVSEEKFHLIPMPPDYDGGDYLKNVNGVLLLVGEPSPSSLSGCMIKLWKLKDYKKQVWVLDSAFVDFARMMLPWMNASLVGTFGSAQVFIAEQLETGIKEVIYCDRSKRIFQVADPNNSFHRDIPGNYVENILPLRSLQGEIVIGVELNSINIPDQQMQIWDVGYCYSVFLCDGC